mmetsp:Transcript_29199/g.88361  ORF Transcript_29199/g.88361 Transcript_29199/m.88361 type:complete len:270 (-) Transcript_29199:377-1186(-)
MPRSSTQRPWPTKSGTVLAVAPSSIISSAAATPFAAFGFPDTHTSMMHAFFMSASGMPSHAISAWRMAPSEQTTFLSCAMAARLVGGSAEATSPGSPFAPTSLNKSSAPVTGSRPSPMGVFQAATRFGGTVSGAGGRNSSSGFESKFPQYPACPPSCGAIRSTADMKSTPVTVSSTPPGNLKRYRPPSGASEKRDAQGPTSNATAGSMSRMAWSCKPGCHSVRRAAHNSKGAWNSAAPCSSRSSRMGSPSNNTSKPLPPSWVLLRTTSV